MFGREMNRLCWAPENYVCVTPEVPNGHLIDARKAIDGGIVPRAGRMSLKAEEMMQ